MGIEIDHVFVCTTSGAPEAEFLVSLGLREGSPNAHPGQGTANRRFFFRNMMLELLHVTDEDEARSPLVAPTYLWERWKYRSTSYSPFGICLRRSKPGEKFAPPFETWKYRPPYLPPGQHISIAAGTAPREPLLFMTPLGGRPDAAPEIRRQPLDHEGGFGEVTRIRITLPGDEPLSLAARSLREAGLIAFVAGPDHLAELQFDGGSRNHTADLRPSLPLLFRW